jgi:aerobic-type carbon monoxide dehydrogenase small subunit (CoxS/CutS family)
MPDVTLTLNGKTISVKEETTVAAALLHSGITAFRHSVSGEPRGPLCGMGICYECRVMIDGEPHARSCQIPCREGMRVTTP